MLKFKIKKYDYHTFSSNSLSLASSTSNDIKLGSGTKARERVLLLPSGGAEDLLLGGAVLDAHIVIGDGETGIFEFIFEFNAGLDAEIDTGEGETGLAQVK